jgi:hypothetical protein
MIILKKLARPLIKAKHHVPFCKEFRYRKIATEKVVL